jgi:hypothetical protein
MGTKWTGDKLGELKRLCLEGKSNSELAAHFGVPVTQIYEKRSKLGITISKCKQLAGK